MTASPSRDHLRERIRNPEELIVFDGAMGTMLYQRGVFINQCYDELNLTAPDLVRSVHADYARAGVDVLETNTFGANRMKLRQYGLEDRVAAINESAVRLAREAAESAGRPEVLIAGAVGPLGVRLEPYGPTSREEAREAFAEQCAALAEAGADLFVFETFGDVSELEEGIAAAREAAPHLPIIAQMTVGVDGRTAYGADPASIARALDAAGADVVGLNCSVGPQTMLEAIEKMVGVTTRKLSAQPNAGLPREVAGRHMYMATPEYMSTYARHLVQSGVRVVGGCCGTTPEHLGAMVEALRSIVPRQRHDRAPATATRSGVAPGGTALAPDVAAVPLAARSRLGRKLADGEFVTSVEIVPPRGSDATRLITDARRLADAGVDAVNIPDGPRAQSRMSAIAASVLLEQQAGIEAVTHYCCRDRNLLGMLSDLLGASALGLRNMLLITGDPPKMGPYPDATAVFDIDAIGLTNLVNNLNHGRDPGGNSIGAPTQFVIGVGVNPAALDLEHELKRFAWKVEAGAEYAITQPVFDAVQLEKFLRITSDFRVPVIAGIWPLASLRNAEFLANEVPGVSIPEAVLARMRAAHEKSREHATEEGLAIARELLEGVRDLVQGVQVSAPFGKVELALKVFA
ncbi:MAG TPA: bifunctional homocysteine S-methyltransferase/methylenetetrahydrofolate reductase [Gemmatimonadales bacterium]|nr:bifunctional homocysteine S-methyltransferase/methylenetetrahydrofolate reductase [Gemmatimonadales bacterium]